MKTFLFLCLTLAMHGIAHAEDLVADYDWQQLAKKGELSEGEPISLDGRSALKIVKPPNAPFTVQLLKIKAPKISQMLYAIRGEVKYENVGGEGYLEMWNCFPGEKPGMPEVKAFTKTLADSGEMGKLTGTSNWREFMLPFNRTGAASPPTRLEVNLVLPGGGAVFLGPLKLVQFKGDSFGPALSNAWWSDRMAGILGGIVGAILGCLGSLLEWLATKGKARSFVLASLRVLIAFGAIASLAGIVALLTGQPYGVWFVLLLIGIIDLAICPHRLRRYHKQYEETELRRMVSLDALKT